MKLTQTNPNRNKALIENYQELKELYKCTLISTTKIANKFNVSRNALIGFCYREFGKRYAETPKETTAIPPEVIENDPKAFFTYKKEIKPPARQAELPEANQCKYAFNSKIPYIFCKEKIEKGAYCLEHYNKCYRKKHV